jgi:hypothetical protein
MTASPAPDSTLPPCAATATHPVLVQGDDHQPLDAKAVAEVALGVVLVRLDCRKRYGMIVTISKSIDWKDRGEVALGVVLVRLDSMFINCK